MGQAQNRARARAAWVTPYLSPYPPCPPPTACIECGVVGEIVGGFFIRKDETSAPSLFISRGNRGSSPISPVVTPISQISAAPPFFPKLKESSAPPPIATSTTNAVDLPHHLRHGSESRQGEGREVGRGAAACGAVKGAGHLPPSACREGAEGVLLPLLVDGDASASAHEGTPGCRFGTGSERISLFRAVLLLRALPALL